MAPEREPDVELRMSYENYCEVNSTMAFTQEICPDGKTVVYRSNFNPKKEPSQMTQSVWFVEDNTNTCPECDGQLATDSKTDETVCSDCGFVVKEGNTDGGEKSINDEEADINDGQEPRAVDSIAADWQEKESYGKSVGEISAPTNEDRLDRLNRWKDENQVEPENESSIWNHDPAIFSLTNYDQTHQEFYRIENPEEFFDGVSGEREMVDKIRENEPSQTVELPYIDWGFGVVL